LEAVGQSTASEERPQRSLRVNHADILRSKFQVERSQVQVSSRCKLPKVTSNACNVAEWRAWARERIGNMATE
jgi:hypothetical protein